ncbi:MAG: NAD-dependent DNA ligase LigA [Myxococcota bacterium]|nr:NAD-dependent DNA ligase LigA [Myxococcota bacterium]
MQSTTPLAADWHTWNAERLAIEIAHHNRRYWDENEPELSDYDYDRLVERLRTLSPQHPILSALGPTMARIHGAAVEHRQPMLSLDKAYDEDALLHWASKFDGDLVMTPKVDGVACSIRYDASGRLDVAATRGSGVVGEDVTANIRALPDVPTSIPTIGREVEVRGEVYLPLSAFRRLAGEFANPRNTCAGALKQKNPERARNIGVRFFAYDVIGPDFATESVKSEVARRWGFTPVEHQIVTRQEVQRGYDDYVARRHDLDFEIDGVVFKAERLDEQVRLGATAHHPRYAIAYKLQGDSAVTTLRECIWSVSRTGALTPVGLVEPVVLSGATVTRISLHNWGLVQDKKLTLNARVVAMRRGGVIPHLEHVVDAGDAPVAPPAHCPSCGATPVIDGDMIWCRNTHECPAQAVGVLAHYARTAGIEGFGQTWLETLVDAGRLRTPADFYRLGVADLMGFERMGETLARKLIEQISQTQTLELDTFLTSLGVPGLGKTAAKTVAHALGTLEVVRAAAPVELELLPKFGALLAQRVHDGLGQRSAVVDDLLRYVTVKSAVAIESSEGPLTGKSFLFTGTLTRMSRADAQARVIELGGSAASGVSKALSFLVVGDAGKAGSKVAKAEKAGVPVLTESAFWNLVDGDPPRQSS